MKYVPIWRKEFHEQRNLEVHESEGKSFLAVLRNSKEVIDCSVCTVMYLLIITFIKYRLILRNRSFS